MAGEQYSTAAYPVQSNRTYYINGVTGEEMTPDQASDNPSVAFVTGDRAIPAKRLRAHYERLYTDGIFFEPSNALQVVANGSLGVTMKPGLAFIGGVMVWFDSDTVLTINPETTATRKALIVMRRDNAKNHEYVYVLDNASTVSKLTNTENIVERALALVTIKPGVVQITNGDIQDLRPLKQWFGTVTSRLPEPDFEGYYSQYVSQFTQLVKQMGDQKTAQQSSWLNQFNSQQNIFMTWMNAIRAGLAAYTQMNPDNWLLYPGTTQFNPDENQSFIRAGNKDTDPIIVQWIKKDINDDEYDVEVTVMDLIPTIPVIYFQSRLEVRKYGPSGNKGTVVPLINNAPAGSPNLDTRIVSYRQAFASADWKLTSGGFTLTIPETRHQCGKDVTILDLRDNSSTGNMSTISSNRRFANGDIELVCNARFAGTVTLMGV